MTVQIENDQAINQVVVYMKGSPAGPPCGYSPRMIQILNHSGVNFITRNVLSSDNLKSEIKTYSGEKTLPKLFIDDAFVGGTDGIRILFESNILRDFLADKGLAANPSEEEYELAISAVSCEEIIACAKN